MKSSKDKFNKVLGIAVILLIVSSVTGCLENNIAMFYNSVPFTYCSIGINLLSVISLAYMLWLSYKEDNYQKEI